MEPAADYLPHLLKRLEHAPTGTAVDLLLQAAEAHPTDARPLLLVAAEFAQSGEIDRAEAAYCATLQRAPQFTIARFQLGLLQLSSGRPAVATHTWAPLDALAQHDPLRLFKRGFECLARDDFAGAVALLEQGIARNTANAPLNRDMQLAIDRIATRRQPPTAAAPADAEPAADHFLVAAYRKLH